MIPPTNPQRELSPAAKHARQLLAIHSGEFDSARRSATVLSGLQELAEYGLATWDENKQRWLSAGYAVSMLRELLMAGPYGGEDFFRVKVTGNGETNWFNVTPAQLAAIASVLDVAEPCEACAKARGSDPDFCDECVADMAAKRNGEST